MHSRFFFLRSRYRIRVAKISKIFMRGGGGGGSGCLILLILLGAKVYAGSKPTYKEK